MKTVRKPAKNIREIAPFSRVLNFVKKRMPKTPYLSGIPPSDRTKNQPERAVNMAEFPQLNGVPL